MPRPTASCVGAAPKASSSLKRLASAGFKTNQLGDHAPVLRDMTQGRKWVKAVA